jgi:hypothetical protein
MSGSGPESGSVGTTILSGLFARDHLEMAGYVTGQRSMFVIVEASRSYLLFPPSTLDGCCTSSTSAHAATAEAEHCAEPGGTAQTDPSLGTVPAANHCSAVTSCGELDRQAPPLWRAQYVELKAKSKIFTESSKKFDSLAAYGRSKIFTEDSKKLDSFADSDPK